MPNAASYLYSDEDVDAAVIEHLRDLGHDVLRAFEDGRANQEVDDDLVLSRAVELGRAVLTRNRRHYLRLHNRNSAHFGIVIYSHDNDFHAAAQRIDRKILAVEGALAATVIRVNKEG